jgi:hypothetical protein
MFTDSPILYTKDGAEDTSLIKKIFEGNPAASAVDVLDFEIVGKFYLFLVFWPGGGLHLVCSGADTADL